MTANFVCIRTPLRYILVVPFTRTLFVITGSRSPTSESEVTMDGSTFFLYNSTPSQVENNSCARHEIGYLA